ncbi:MAG: hypothetical protein AB1715_12105, partial [Acidobacteriota bacterium]
LGIQVKTTLTVVPKPLSDYDGPVIQEPKQKVIAKRPVQLPWIQSVKGPSIKSLSLNPKQLKSGGIARLTVLLDGPAPEQGADIRFSVSPPNAVSVPAGLLVNRGQTSATCSISSPRITRSIKVKITATYRERSKSLDLIISPEKMRHRLR